MDPHVLREAAGLARRCRRAWSATEQLGVLIGDGVIWTPAVLSLANSSVCAFCAAVTSAAIACGVMSGVPVICSCLRLELTVFRP